VNEEVKFVPHHLRFTRRDAMRLSAGALFSAGLWPGALAAEGEKDSGAFHFLVVNDLHYHNELCERFFDHVLAKMKSHAEKPELCLVVGDVADTGNRTQLTTICEWCKSLGMPAYVVPGNHDYAQQNDRASYDNLFPGRLNYYFDHRGWQFVGLDSTDGIRAIDVTIGEPTLRWLDTNLPRLDRKKPTVLFTHFPLGPNVSMRPTNADAVLERLKAFNLQAAYCGHYHGLTERTVGATTVTTNRCCSFFRDNHEKGAPKGYFLCRAQEGKIKRKFVEV
jgi:hypothetical protein